MRRCSFGLALNSNGLGMCVLNGGDSG
ncbi:hypothetical protein J2W24_004765 [Variovorax boronicumulans]|nr:hypothetical protein [Variovorax boronicumulans]